MNKTEMKNIVNKAIEESNLNGYTWKFDGNKLTWSYLTVEYFSFEIRSEDEFTIVSVKYHMPHIEAVESFKTFIVGDDIYCDYRTVEEAVAEITKATIRKANSTF